jgi:glutamine amidotransferase-like uncharacterized protein
MFMGVKTTQIGVCNTNFSGAKGSVFMGFCALGGYFGG